MTMTTEDAPVSQPNILERIRAHSARMSSAEQRVARTVLAEPAAVIHQSVSELALASGSSPATVVRFCQTLQLRGYQALKLALAREMVPPERELVDEVAVNDSPADVVRKVFTGAATALESAARSVDSGELSRLADLLVAARRVLFAAVGTSAPLASDVAYRLTTIGVDARFIADAHVQHVSARMLEPGDLCVAVSHTGSTTETLAAVSAAAASGAATAAITSFVRSPLTELADRVVVAGSRETAYRIEAMTSRVVHLLVLDALYTMVAVRRAVSSEALSTTADVLTEHRI
jgi:DNA-binding MurR/RpiR family transcriptional regulator